MGNCRSGEIGRFLKVWEGSEGVCVLDGLSLVLGGVLKGFDAAFDRFWRYFQHAKVF